MCGKWELPRIHSPKGNGELIPIQRGTLAIHVALMRLGEVRQEAPYSRDPDRNTDPATADDSEKLIILKPGFLIATLTPYRIFLTLISPLFVHVNFIWRFYQIPGNNHRRGVESLLRRGRGLAPGTQTRPSVSRGKVPDSRTRVLPPIVQ